MSHFPSCKFSLWTPPTGPANPWVRPAGELTSSDLYARASRARGADTASQRLSFGERAVSPLVCWGANGFLTEGFAKCLGPKVTVRGVSTPGETGPAFQARAQKRCVPQTPQ